MNVGNTCYVNSLIQSYYFVVPFRNMILKLQFPDELYRVGEELERALSNVPPSVTQGPVFGPQPCEYPLKGGNEFPPPKSMSTHADDEGASSSTPIERQSQSVHDDTIVKKRRSEKQDPASKMDMVKKLVQGVTLSMAVEGESQPNEPSAPPMDQVMTDSVEVPEQSAGQPVVSSPTPVSDIENRLKQMHISSLRALRFLNELQLLFALMQFSKKAVLDPSAMLNKLYSYNDVRLTIGDEQDVCEFNNLFLHNVCHVMMR